MTELKPCPFCGGEAELKINSFHGSYKTVYVICKSCKTRTNNYGASIDYCAIDRAIELWNRRASNDT